MNTISPILLVILGILLLTTGKKLYWFFIAVVGFIGGLVLTTQYLELNPPWLVYVVALGLGVIGAILATFIQKIALAVVGFFVGGYGALYLIRLLGFQTDPITWLAFIIGGIIGILMVTSVFNWALYILSSWAGATLITDTITRNTSINTNVGLVILFVLFILGMIIQAGLFKEKPKPKTAQVKPEVQPANKEEKGN